MKSVIVIILVVAGCFAAIALMLRAVGVHVYSLYPMTGGAIAMVAGIAGIVPLIRRQGLDVGTLLNRAMMGTMLHMLIAAGLSISVIATYSHEQRRELILWILSGYWISLLTVVWQSRQIIVTASAVTPRGADKSQ